MIPARIIRALLPKEVKDMLEALKGSRTILLLVIGNLPQVIEAATNLLNGTGHANIAENVVKVGTGILSLVTVILRVLPEDKKNGN